MQVFPPSSIGEQVSCWTGDLPGVLHHLPPRVRSRRARVLHKAVLAGVLLGEGEGEGVGAVGGQGGDD